MLRTNAPSPAPSGAPWTLFFGLAAVAGIALAIAVLSVVRLRRLSAANEVPAATTATARASAPRPVIVPPGPEADESAPRGTPTASLRARPAWGKREHLTPHAKVTTQYAPQLGNPLETFLSAAPLGPDFDDGVVVCRFQSFNAHDTFAGDDLHARVTFGAAPEVANDGPEDGNLAFVSAPLVRLAKGDRISYQVFDRDVFGITPLTTTAVVFAGAPVVAVDGGAAVECRGLRGEALGKAVAARSTAASVTIAEVERAKLDESRSDWGYPNEAIARGERQIADIAALTGWDEPRAHERVTSLDAAAASARASRERLFDRLHGGAKSSFRQGTFEVTVDAASGGPASVTVSVKNEGATPASFGAYPSTIYLATRSDGPVFATVTSATGHPAPIAPGVTEKRTIATIGTLPEGPLLLGACTGHHCGFARAR